MQVEIFDFDLDRSLIADKPANPRDTSRLLDLSDGEHIKDRHFYDLPDILQAGDVLVFNDTKVIPARLYGSHGEAKVEVTLYHPIDGLNVYTKATRFTFIQTPSHPKILTSAHKSSANKEKKA